MFRSAITVEPHGCSYEQLGKVLVMQDRPKEALHEYQEALKLMPDNADTLCQFGLLCLRQGAFLPCNDKPDIFSNTLGTHHVCSCMLSRLRYWLFG